MKNLSGDPFGGGNARKTGDAGAIHPQEPPKGLAYALLTPSPWGM
jgi:hypothetical protein